MLKNVLICVLENKEHALKVGLKLEKVLEDFRPVCGKVAELKIEESSIFATYCQDEHWSGFLTGVSYAITSGVNPLK